MPAPNPGLNLPFGNQIQFSLNPEHPSDPSTLWDYKEGLWTPTILGSGGQNGQVYGTQFGRYTKIGQTVYIHGRITLTTLGTVTTSARLGGLPFPCIAQNNNQSILTFWFLNLSLGKIEIIGLISPNTSFADLYTGGGAVTSLVNLVQADLSNTTDLIFSGFYTTA